MSLMASVEEEEQAIETIISCVEAEDTKGVLRAANELAEIRRKTGTTDSMGQAQ